MNILVVPSWYKTEAYPNQGSFFFEQAKALRRLGHNVFIADATLQGKKDYWSKRCYKLTKFDDEGIIVYSYVTPSLGRFRLESSGWKTVYRNLKKIMLRMNKDNISIDIIHAHSYLPAGIASVRIGKKYNIPVVFTEHSSDMLSASLSRKRQKILSYVVKGSKKVIGVGNALCKAILENIDHKPQMQKIVTIPNVVSTDFYPCAFEKEESKEFTFISVGNLIQRKRFDLTIEAFSIFLERCKHARLFIVGDGPKSDDLRELVISKGLHDQVLFCGSKNRMEVAELMRNSNCMVLPSDCETFGVVYIEALASGIPVVATRNGGAEDIINDGRGCLIDRNNVCQLAEAMVYIYENYYKFDAHALAKCAIDEYGEEAVGKRLESIFLCCLSELGEIE